MSQFVKNSTDFSAACGLDAGECMVARENFVFLEDAEELAAVDYLQRKCGHIVITPDASASGKALLYHTSCRRMADVARQIFEDSLEAPVSLPQYASELTLGELHRQSVSMSYEDCRARVEGFGF